MKDQRSIEFLGKNYTENSLSSMSEEDLLALRNIVAQNLGVARINGFKDLQQAVKFTWKALVKFDETDDENLASNEKQKQDPEPKGPKIVKGALPHKVKRPTRNMFRRIEKIKEPDRVRSRWDNYKDGMTILEIMEGDDMTHLDIYWYAANGFVKLHDPIEDEYQEGVAAWYEREGLENPEKVKQKRKEEKAKRAAEKAKEAEAKKKEKLEAEKAAA